MKQDEVVHKVRELCGSLSVPEGTQQGDLRSALRAVAEAIINGQPEPMTSASPAFPFIPPAQESDSDKLAEIQSVVADLFPSNNDPAVRVFLRQSPLLTPLLEESEPAWARGWAPETTLGPLRQRNGRLIWFDLRKRRTFALLIEMQTGRVLAALPQGSQLTSGAAITVELARGSLWISGALLDKMSPAGGFAGLRIRGGTLRLAQPASTHGADTLVPPGTSLTFELDLDLPPRPPGSTAGGDAKDARADLPERATIEITASEATLLIDRELRLKAYGTTVGLRLPDGSSSVARYQSQLGGIGFPLLRTVNRFRISNTDSRVMWPSGEARIGEAAWVLPVAVPSGGYPQNLGEASGDGSLMLQLKGGVQTIMPAAEFRQPVSITDALLTVTHGSISLLATTQAPRGRVSLRLWTDEAERTSALELSGSNALQLRLGATVENGGAEVVQLSGLRCRAQLSKPVTARGERVPFESDSATLSILDIPAGLHVQLDAVTTAPVDPVTGQLTQSSNLSFALSNAFARTGPARALQISASLGNDGTLSEGSATLWFAVAFLLPSLPDPYAANIRARVPRELLDPAAVAVARAAPMMTAHVSWTGGADPKLAFDIASGAEASLSKAFTPVLEHPFHTPAPGQANHLPVVEARYADEMRTGADLFRLVDVSSRADQFGVAFARQERGQRGQSSLALQTLDLVAPLNSVSAFILPPFQWETVYDIPNPKTAPGFPPALSSPTDGGPSRFAITSGTLVPITPISVLDTLVDEYNSEQQRTVAARFTLPFGIVAATVMANKLGPAFVPVFDTPHVSRIRPKFTSSGYEGARQISLTPAVHVLQTANAPDPGLPGIATQTNNGTAGFNVLKIPGLPADSIDTIFNNVFGKTMQMVPVRRIDFSGYGGSTFSDWRHSEVKGSGVTQVRFEASVGRASREVVQVKCKVYPWGPVFTRDIVMLRTGSGGVFRRDSGWQPASDAEYKFDPASNIVVHHGLVPKLVNLRNIRDTANAYERVYPGKTVRLVQVLFDADAVVEGVTAGANKDRLVPTNDIVGYVQILPTGMELTDDELSDMLAATGPVGAPIVCEVNLAGSGLHQTLSRVEVGRAPMLGGTPQFATAARGTVEIAHAGEWSFAYQNASDTEPRQLDAHRPVPLIRANPAGGITMPYRFAEPEELHQTQPKTQYFILQSTSAQRLLIPRPEVHANEPILHAGAPMLFADMYTLAMGTALFPRADLCFALPAGSQLRITGRKKLRLEIPPQTGLAPGEFHVGHKERTLAQASALRVRSRFTASSTVKFIVDSDATPNWSCVAGPVAILGDIDVFDELVQVSGHISSSATAQTEIVKPTMQFGGPLKPVQVVIDFLTLLGFPFPLKIEPTNREYAFKSGVKYKFPDYGFVHLEEAIENAIGVMPEVDLVAGFGKASKVKRQVLGSESNPHGWHVFVEVEAKLLGKAIELGIAKAYTGGAMKFEVGGNDEGHTEIKLALGLSGAIKGEAGVLTFEGKRTYLGVLKHVPAEKEIKFGVSTGWELEAAVLKGLAALAVSFEILVTVERLPSDLVYAYEQLKFKGKGEIAFDITYGWICTKTYEEEFEVDERLAAVAFVAGTVLP